MCGPTLRSLFLCSKILRGYRVAGAACWIHAQTQIERFSVSGYRDDSSLSGLYERLGCGASVAVLVSTKFSLCSTPFCNLRYDVWKHEFTFLKRAPVVYHRRTHMRVKDPWGYPPLKQNSTKGGLQQCRLFQMTLSGFLSVFFSGWVASGCSV